MPDEIQVASDAAPASPPPPEESGSLSDHEARYGEGAQSTQAEPSSPPAELPAGEPDSADEGTPETDDAAGPRDPTTGRFLPKGKRHRAESAIAGPADVPRIRELTARLRATEAERDQLRAQTSVPRETPAPAPAPVAATPKPTPDQFNDYSEFIDALTDWKTDQKLAAWEAKRVEAEHQRHAVAETKRITTSWEARKAAARVKYPDFDSVAIETPTTIPVGSLIDAWILDPDEEASADMLYHLQQHPEEVQRILNQSVLQQAKSLALLAQRFNGHPPRTAAAATGSAPAPAQTPTPRPPNPVRTGPLRTGDEPPDEEVASLADHEKWYAPRRKRGG